MTSLTFEPLLTPVAWISLAVVAIGLLVWYAMRRPKSCHVWVWATIIGLTGLGLAAVLLLLLNPLWLEPLPPPAGKPLLTVLVDESQSMALDDGPNQTSRFQAAAVAVKDVEKRFQSTFDVRVQRFSEQSLPTSPEQLAELKPQGKVSDLAAPILDSLVSDRPQGQALLLLSDGIHNAPGDVERVLEAAEMAKSWDAPIYTMTIGTQTTVRDLEVRVPRSQELAFVNQSIPVTVELRQHGTVGDRVKVVLTADEEELESREVRISPDGTTSVSFLITPPEVGLFQYQVKADLLPGEATSANNSANFQVRIVDEPVRALVLEGKPYWDAKFLLRMLTDDPSLEVDCVVRVTTDRFLWRRLQLVEADADNGEKAGADASADSAEEGAETAQDNSENEGDAKAGRLFVREEKVELVGDVGSILQDRQRMKDYQIIVLGREAESYLSGSAAENMRDWLSRDGGSLICYRGSPVAEPDQKLSRLLPVRWTTGRTMSNNESRFRVQVTARGDDLSWLRLGGGGALEKLPSLAASQATQSVKPLTVVLGRGVQGTGTTPVLTYQPYGTGKVVVVEGAGMWRWAFLPPEYQEHDSVYGTLWQSLMRWVVSSGGLLPGEEVSLQMDRVSYTNGEAISAVVLRLEGADPKPLPHVELYGDDGELVQSAQPIPVGSEPGVYQVFLGQLGEGHYRANLAGDDPPSPGTRSVQFDVRPDLREQLEVSARPDLMKRIAEVSEGAELQPSELSNLADTFEDHLRKSRPVQYRRIVAWDRWWVLTGILLIWSLTWSLRRSHGLI